MKNELRNTIERADAYIEERAKTVRETYRHTYHVMPPVGWINDPNGFCYAFGKYHVFHQFHPYAAAWGPMHWGHLVSDDLVHWDRLPTAIAPDMPYDHDGCFSGSAIEREGVFYLMYTAVADGKQTQALARSTDGIHFEKLGLVIGSEQVPSDCSQADFRDPYLFVRGGRYYCLIGGKHKDGDGVVHLYRSDDLFAWTYVGRVWKDGRTHSGIYECPSFATFGETDLLFTSPQLIDRVGIEHENINGNLCMMGHLDLETGAFTRQSEREVDGGMDIYAPQILPAPDGRVLMIAWQQMWDRTFPTAPHGWAGALTLPRELTLRDGTLFQAPVRELAAYHSAERCYDEVEVTGERTLEGVEGRCVDLSFVLRPAGCTRAGVKVYCGDGCETVLSYEPKTGILTLDRSRMGTLIQPSPGEVDANVRHVHVGENREELDLRIVLDVSSCEVFAAGGERTLTGNVYSPGEGIVFFSEGGTARVSSVKKYDVTVAQK